MVVSMHLRHSPWWADLPVFFILVLGMPSVCRHFASRDARKAERDYLQDKHAEASEARDAILRAKNRLTKTKKSSIENLKHPDDRRPEGNPPYNRPSSTNDQVAEIRELRAELATMKQQLDKSRQTKVELEAQAQRRSMTPDEMRKVLDEYKGMIDPRIDLGHRPHTHDLLKDF